MALYDLAVAGRLEMPVVGVASSDWDDAALHRTARETIEAAGIDIDESVFGRLTARLCKGDQALFARQDGVMEAWRIVDPILTDGPPVHTYPRGSRGPEQADSMVEEWITR